MDTKLTVSSTPHVRSNDTTRKIMCDVCIALLPATLVGIYYYKLNAIFVILLAVLSSVGFEYGFERIAKRPITIYDFSAVVTGLLLALNLPAYVPFYVPIVGSFVAIVVVKQLFGGLGQNFMNPALAGRAFLLASYPTSMTKFTLDGVTSATSALDGVTSATPLTALKEGVFLTTSPAPNDYINAFLGNIGGCIGEVSALAILIGASYLFYKKIITWHTPFSYIGSAIILFYIFGRNGLFTGFPLYEILLGGILLGAFFMATDYSSSPITPKGKIIFGVGCAVLTVVIRIYGGYPEGVSYSILLMNLCVPLIDKFTRPRVFGVKKEAKSRG